MSDYPEFKSPDADTVLEEVSNSDTPEFIKFDVYYDRLKDYLEKNNEFPKSDSKEKEAKLLSWWVSRQKEILENGTLLFDGSIREASNLTTEQVNDLLKTGLKHEDIEKTLTKEQVDKLAEIGISRENLSYEDGDTPKTM